MSWEAKTSKRLLIRRRLTSAPIARLTVWDTGFSNLNFPPCANPGSDLLLRASDLPCRRS